MEECTQMPSSTQAIHYNYNPMVIIQMKQNVIKTQDGRKQQCHLLSVVELDLGFGISEDKTPF